MSNCWPRNMIVGARHWIFHNCLPLAFMLENSSDGAPSQGQRPALSPPQFRLSTLLWVVAALSALFSAMTAAGPLGGFVLLLMVLAVLAHIVGNSIGTRLRSCGNATIDDRESAPAHHRDAHIKHKAPASNLANTSGVTRSMVIFTVSGAVLMGTLGASLLMWFVWGRLNLPTAIVAIVSPAVLGGLLGFAISSFTRTAGGAWREAHVGHLQERRPRPAHAESD